MFSCFQKLEFKKKDTIILSIAFVLLAVGIWLWWKYPLTLSSGREVAYPYYATMDKQGNAYIINEGKSEILKVSPYQEILARLSNMDHQEDVFWEANDVAVDETGNIYVHDVHWMDTGLGMAEERIIKFDANGNYLEVVFSKEYTETMIMKRHFFALEYREGEILFAVADDLEGSITVYGISGNKNEAEVRQQIFREDVESIQDIAIGIQEQVYYVDKFGAVYRWDGEETCVYQTPEKTFILPYSITVAETGEIYFTDLCNSEVYQIRDMEVSKFIDSELYDNMARREETEALLTIEAAEGNLFLTSGNRTGYMNLESGSYSQFTIMSYKTFFQAMIILRCMAFAIAAIIFFYYLLVLLNYLIASKVVVKNQGTIIMIAAVACTTIVVMSSMLNHLKDIYVEERLSNMCTVSQIATDTIDAELLHNVTYPADYGNDSYVALQEFMNQLIDVTSVYSENIYCNLVKLQDGRYYALAYMDNSIGAYYPLDAGESEEARKVYKTKESYINDGKSDSTGSYVYVKAPVIDDSGEIAGIVEVGMVSDTLGAKIDEIRTKIMVSITLIVIIAIFLIKEVMSFWISHKEWKQKKAATKAAVFPISWFRIFVVLCFAAYNMPTCFLPVYMESFYDKSLPMSVELAGSLPLTANFMMIGIMSLLCSGFICRLGFRMVIMLGGGFSLIGDLTMSVASDYWMAVGGLILNGIGCGFIMNALSIIVANQSNEEQEEGFSVMSGSILTGMISGTVIGAALAENIGETKMFLFSSGIWFVLILFGLITGGAFKMKAQIKEKQEKKSTFRFLRSGKTLGYFICMVVPFTIIGGFTSYFLPVFAAEYGLTESQTSLLLVMNCLVGIFLSETLTKVMLKSLGRGAIYLSTILSLAGLVLFGMFQNLYMLAFVLLLLGAARSFGAPIREITFCGQEEVQDYGEDRAMGLYNFADNVGDSLGTIVFGSILTVGFSVGMWALSGVSVVMMLIYEGIWRKKK